MSPDVYRVVIRWFVEDVLNTGELAAVDELFVPNYRAQVPGHLEPLNGVEAWKQWMASYRAAFPDLQITIEDMVAEGDRVAARLLWRGTHSEVFMGVAPTGQRTSIPGIGIWRIAGGRMVAEWAGADLLSLLHLVQIAPRLDQHEA